MRIFEDLAHQLRTVRRKRLEAKLAHAEARLTEFRAFDKTCKSFFFAKDIGLA